MPRPRKKQEDSPEMNLDLLQQAFVDQSTKKFGEAGIIDTENNAYGIPLRGCLPLQYLMGVDVIPLERAFSIVGPTGSYKSLLAWWYLKQFMELGGLAVFLDVEKKTSWDQVWALLGQENRNRLIPQNVDFVEDLQDKMGMYAAQYHNMCPKKDVPFVMAIDSVGALSSIRALEQLKKEGITDKGFAAATRAGALTEFFRVFLPGFFSAAPMCLILVNHQKIGMDGSGGKGIITKHSPGGVHKDYMGTYTIEMSKSSPKHNVKDSSVDLYMKVLKSSLGRTNLKIKVRVLTEYDEKGVLSRTYFDWDHALTCMLTDKNTSMSVPEARAIVGLTGDGNKVSSKPLGLQNVTAQEMGAAIHANEKMVEELQGVFHVSRKTKFGEPSSKSV